MNIRFLSTSAVLGISCLSVAQITHFTPGKLVTGRSSYASTGPSVAVELVQLDKTGLTQTPTSIYTLPTGTSGLTMSGSATSEGQIGRDLNGRHISMFGYAAASGTASIAGTASSSTSRVAGRLNFDGSYDLSSKFNALFSGNNPRSCIFSASTISDAYRIWAAGGTSGIVTSSLSTTGGAQISTTNNVSNRSIQIVNNNLIFTTGSGTKAIYSISSLMTSAPSNPLTSASSLIALGPQTPTYPTGSSAVTINSPYSFCFVGNVAASGTLYCYVADDAAGLSKFKSTNGLSGPFTYEYRVTTTNFRSICTDGKLIFGVTAATNSNNIVAVLDGGYNSGTNTVSKTEVTLNSATSSSQQLRGIQLAPEPTVVDSDYTSGGTGASPVPGNIMVLRSSDGAQRSLKVGLVPDSGHRTWTSLATVNYDGHAVKSAVDSSGNTYILIQSVADGGSSTIIPTVQISKVPVGGGSASSSSVVNLAAGDEAFAITVDSSNRPVIAYRPSSGAQTVKFVRWNSDLTTDASYTNSGSGFSSGSKTPIDIAYNPNSGKYLTTLFATGNTMSTTDFSSTFSNGSATSDLSLSADLNSVAVTPQSIQFGSDGKLRVLSVGSTTATRALLRVDTLTSDMTTVNTAGTNYRRDVTGTPLVLNGAAAKASATTAYLWALGLSMNGNLPCVLMTGIGESTTGPSGVGNGSNENIIGSGKIWTMTSSNAIGSGSKATASFAPGFTPVN